MNRIGENEQADLPDPEPSHSNLLSHCLWLVRRLDRLPAAPRTREVLEGLRARCGDERADMLTVYFAAMAAAGLIRINDRIDEVNRDMILYAVFALGTKLGVTAEEGNALLAAHKADLADMEAAHGK